MCLALLDGRAWTAGDLARSVGIAPSTASKHLNLLVAVGVLRGERQGRHRYVRLADDEIAELIESLAARAPAPRNPPRGLRMVTTTSALARARTCYDHLAGSLGVAITDALVDRNYLTRQGGLAFSREGVTWLEATGVDLPSTSSPNRRPLARACLDWTERRSHLAGRGGAALCHHFVEAGWIERIGSGRAVQLTAVGQQALRAALDLKWPPVSEATLTCTP